MTINLIKSAQAKLDGITSTKLIIGDHSVQPTRARESSLQTTQEKQPLVKAGAMLDTGEQSRQEHRSRQK